jgi:hypothetical protein
MSKLMMFAALAAVAGMTAGCFTSAVAFTKKTAPDGTVTESKVKIVGTGDKASQIAAEGLFADGAPEDLGAGVKNASATQQSTGIKETLEGMGSLLGGIGALMAKTQGIPVATAATTATTVTDTAPVVSEPVADTDYSTEGFSASPGADGSGVYGKTSCSRCRAFKTAHPDVPLIDLADAGNKKTMWDALRRLGYAGTSVSLPVAVSGTGFTQAAK